MYTIFYLFGILGIFLFGGLVKTTSPEIIYNDSTPDLYVLNNFNDLASAFVTLFELMVVNNWQVTAYMYVALTNNSYMLFYFVFFYYFCVLIGINIVIAFAIDMFNSIVRLDN